MGRKISEERRNRLLQLSCRMQVQFRDIGLLDTALTHTSYANEARKHIGHNERMEFLGDAVLELASSTYLYEHFPNLSEGELTKTRASIVCSTTLARLARGLGLGDCLLLGHGEEQGGGRTRTSNLEDAFEAVIGAVYLDQGWETARAYVFRQLVEEFRKVEQGGAMQDYKTVLQELVQRHAGNQVLYELMGAKGPDHDKEFFFAVRINGEVYGQGHGRSKKEAEQHAAREALARMRKE
ncbi:MAG: ribonuclease III [Selenomonadaceae bacterium]|nr:ribonuclease III [Selenomonadaceae bacterium]